MSVTPNLPPVLRQRYFDSNGLPLAGGQLFTYQAGTTTPQATYTDQTGGTPNANPIILDSQGYASMWLDQSLSYKFVLEDSNGVVQWTVDQVVGLLTANAVSTASIQDGAVTSSKLASGSVNVTNSALASDGSIDANRPVNTNNIRNGAITTAKIASGAVTRPLISGLLSPTVQEFKSGSGTYNLSYQFAVSANNATAGATYTVGGNTYTVVQTISSGNLLWCTGSVAPPASGTLTRASGSGDATIAYTSVAAPIFLQVKMVGGGSGGTGGGNSGGGAGAGGTGGNTTFGSSLLVANGGAIGAPGSASLGSAIGTAISGAVGGGGFNTTSSGPSGGMGAATPFGGGGGGGAGGANAGNSGIVNTGAGGGGGGSGGTGGATTISGAGGSSGGYVDAIISSPSVTYSYAVGAAGSAGGAGTNGAAGGSGGSGYICVIEHYQ